MLWTWSTLAQAVHTAVDRIREAFDLKLTESGADSVDGDGAASRDLVGAQRTCRESRQHAGDDARAIVELLLRVAEPPLIRRLGGRRFHAQWGDGGEHIVG